MTVFTGSIMTIVAGDDLDVTRTVIDVPATQTLSKAWLTFKTNIDALDPGLLQKVITPSPVAGQGQITDTAADGTGTLIFQLTAADTLALPVGVSVPYDVKVKTSADKIYTAEQGIYLAIARVTQTTT